MGAIFLSYAREDGAFAEALARVLGEAGHDIWWDRRINSGEEFATEIEEALGSADIVLVVWSKHSVRSPWVRDEAAIGRNEGRLLPVTIDGSPPPLGFRQFQTLELRAWKGSKRDPRTKGLLQSVEGRLKPKSTEASAPLEPAASALGGRILAPRRRLLAIALALFVIVAVAGAFLIPRLGGGAEPASVAVLPFKNMSAGDPYFAEGVAEEISNQLSREPQFRVTGRTSASLFKDAADLRDVGRRLHVDYVLEGSVRSAGQQVRVDVALVKTSTGVRLWSQDFGGSLNDIFAIQDSIGQQVGEHVRRQLIRTAASSTTKTSGDVYALFVTARTLMRQREPAKLGAAVDLLKQALKLDPNYAPTWARLALADHLYEFYTDQPASDASRAQHIRFAEHAIALAPKLAEPHAILGLFLSGTLNAEDRKRARQELETAVALDPGNAEAWYWLSSQRLANLEFIGGLEAIRRTALIDPFLVQSESMPPLAWDMGYRDEATRALRNSIANHPEPFMRALAQAQLAALHYDLSGAYEYGKAARDIAPPDVRDVTEGPMGSALLRLGFLNEAERFVPRPIVDLRRGKYTFSKSVGERFPRAGEFWIFNGDEEHLLTRVVLKTGRSRELVALYDAAFSSPDDMATRYTRLGFVLNAPLLAIALQKAGRGRDGVRMILIADAMCKNAAGSPHAPMSFRVSCSRVAALAGRSEEAIQMLEQAVAEGWRPSEGEYGNVSEEPAYWSFRDDRRLVRINSIIAADVERERRELTSSGF